jgi:hypothetical protein
VVALAVVLLTVLLTAFAWPATRSQPRDVPLAVAAPPPVAAQVTSALEENRPGAFEITTVRDGGAARHAIEQREVYGAIVLDAQGPRVLTASAASPVVAQSLQQVAAALSGTLGAPVPVEDVVPAPADDPRGAGLGAGALPLALGGVAVAGLLSRTVRSSGRRLAAAALIAVVGGLVLTGLLQGWLGALTGGYWSSSGVVALGIAAVALPLLGLHALAGIPGLALGAATVVLLGNPLSAAASAPEFLPAGLGGLGQLLPPGATLSALRSVAFFDGAAAAGPLWVLTAWAVAGLLLVGVAATRGARRDRNLPEAVVERRTAGALG